MISEKEYSKNVTVVIRPEDIDVLPSDGQDGTIGTLVRQIYLGDRNDCTIQFGDIFLRVHTENKFSLNIGDDVKLVLDNACFIEYLISKMFLESKNKNNITDYIFITMR